MLTAAVNMEIHVKCGSIHVSMLTAIILLIVVKHHVNCTLQLTNGFHVKSLALLAYGIFTKIVKLFGCED